MNILLIIIGIVLVAGLNFLKRNGGPNGKYVAKNGENSVIVSRSAALNGEIKYSFPIETNWYPGEDVEITYSNPKIAKVFIDDENKGALAEIGILPLRSGSTEVTLNNPGGNSLTFMLTIV